MNKQTVLKIDNIEATKANISQIQIKNIISTGTITFYDENGKPITTTISDLVNRIYKVIASKSN